MAIDFVRMDAKMVMKRLHEVLFSQASLEGFISWFFAEHSRIARFQTCQRQRGEATLDEQVAASTSPASGPLNELFMDLENYRTEEERALGLEGFNELELRECLVVRLSELKDALRDSDF